MTLKELQIFVKKVSKKFSEKENILDALARLTEECGELASEVRKLEKKGSKVYFGIAGNKEKLADELVDILNVISAIANLYGLDLDRETDRRNTHIKKVLKIKD